MNKFVFIIIALLIYFLGGWIVKDIVFSSVDWSGDTTLYDMFFYETLIYSIIAGVIVIGCLIKADKENGAPLYLIIGMAFVIHGQYIPICLGLVVLYNLVNLICMIWAICLLPD